MSILKPVNYIEVEKKATSHNYLNNPGNLEIKIKIIRFITAFEFIGRKLNFFNAFLDFLKIICAKILANNQQYQTNLLTPYNDFGKLLLQLRVAKVKGDIVILNKSFQKAIQTDISLVKKQWKHYQFINQLIAFYNQRDENIYIGKAWKNMIAEKKLDYEVRLCETLINLEKYEYGKKISNPFDESYYTQSGKNAFDNYTKFIFADFVQLINEEIQLNQVLDIGCGYGNYIQVLKDNYPEVFVTGLELNPEVATQTQKTFQSANKITILNSNIFDFSGEKKYDLILLNYVLFYFTYDEKVKLFEHLNGMLTEKGRILVCQYYSEIENFKVSLSSILGDESLSKRIEIYYANKISYANSFWNDTVDAFKEAERFVTFKDILKTTGYQIQRLHPADRFYYSFFIEIVKNK